VLKIKKKLKLQAIGTYYIVERYHSEGNENSPNREDENVTFHRLDAQHVVNHLEYH